MTLFSRSHLHKAATSSKRCFKLRTKLKFQKKIERKEMTSRFMELKVEMEEISEEQKNIKQGQKQVQEKLEAIEEECEQLRKETDLIIQQSTHTQLRLILMFEILKAREESDFFKAAQLTQLLRELIARTTSGIE